MTSRVTFGPALAHAIRIRGLTLTEVARRAHLTLATVSRAADGWPVNMTTARQIAQVVSACPVVPELEEWGRDPTDLPATRSRTGGHPAELRDGLRSGRPRPMARASEQLLIAMD